MNEKNETQPTNQSNLAQKLDATGWALFFIWIGIAFLLKFQVAIGLLGVGIITLGIQVVRKIFNVKVDGFWFVIGLLFILGSLGALTETRIPIIPILLILAGITLLYSIIRRGHGSKE